MTSLGAFVGFVSNFGTLQNHPVMHHLILFVVGKLRWTLILARLLFKEWRLVQRGWVLCCVVFKDVFLGETDGVGGGIHPGLSANGLQVRLNVREEHLFLLNHLRRYGNLRKCFLLEHK